MQRIGQDIPEAGRPPNLSSKGRYTVREWERDGNLRFDPSTNKHYDFNN